MNNSIIKRFIPVCIVTAALVIFTALFSFSTSAVVAPRAAFPKTQSELEIALSSTSKSIYLAADITTDKVLVVPEGSKISLSLMGHTIKRNNDSVTLEGNVFRVESGGSLGISDSTGMGTVTGGAANNGGAIMNYGDLYIYSGIFTGNTANKGAVIANEGTATITGGAFKGNEAADSGGAVYNNGTLYIKGGNFTENSSKKKGGALYLEGPSETNVSNVTFSGNASSYGGAVYVSGGSTLSIEDNILIEGNTAMDGGGIMNYATIYFDGTSQIVGNSSTQYGGGGISNHGAVEIRGTCKVMSNKAAGCGGGIWSGKSLICAEGSSLQVRNNRTDSDGGGMKVLGTARLDNAVIYNNIASGNGGGVWNGTDASIDNSTIWYNISGNDGGGVYNSEGKNIKINNSVIRKNKSKTGAGIFICSKGTADINTSKINENATNNNGNGGGIWIGDYDQTHVILSDTSLDSNSANRGGALYRRGGTLEINRCSISGNNSKGSGGGIYSRLMNDGSYDFNVRLIHCDFQNNIADSGDGGAVCFDNEGDLYNIGDKAILGCSFTGNNADNGGAVYAASCRTLIEESTVENNTADYSGGGVFVNNQDLILKGKVIINNNSSRNSTKKDLCLNGGKSCVISPGMRKGSYVSVDSSESMLSYNATEYQMGFFHPSDSSKKLSFTKQGILSTPLYASVFGGGKIFVIIVGILAGAAMMIAPFIVKKRKERENNENIS